MDHIEDIKIIEQYWEGALSPSEKNIFQKRLENEPKFKRANKEYNLLVGGIEAYGRQETLAFLKELDKKLPQIKKPRIISIQQQKWFAAAAVVLILLSTGLFNMQQSSATDIYEAYHQAYPPLVNNTVRGSNKHENTTSEAYAAYSAGDYKKAIRLFDQAAAQNNYTDLFYKANALLEDNQTQKALENFHTVYQHSEIFRSQTQWYSTLR